MRNWNVRQTKIGPTPHRRRGVNILGQKVLMGDCRGSPPEEGPRSPSKLIQTLFLLERPLSDFIETW